MIRSQAAAGALQTLLLFNSDGVKPVKPVQEDSPAVLGSVSAEINVSLDRRVLTRLYYKDTNVHLSNFNGILTLRV